MEHISFPFSYVDYELGKVIKKERNIPSATIETIEKEEKRTPILQWNIDLQRDYPFEQVEQFLALFLTLFLIILFSLTLKEKLHYVTYRQQTMLE
ncbi:hypothetical protein LR68_03070 [Anoxybacillus sp. BCO1]|nr:hypothetical protein LR68_03070 [Anoxybacillus sp. BCO1]